ncbi:MAG: DNA-damage-inducible protein D [Methanoregulaceae archaeon PtaB.Bin108]|nr:MAG: DNA-damage-inducible protein D [Methanoregulaceae archaeon PtaB.Bin108]
MKSEVIQRLHKNFEDYVNHEDEIEFWYARDLQTLLGYTEWRNFQNAVDRAKESCKNAKQDVENHFRNVKKRILIGQSSYREISDVMLTRYACYLIAQNGDPRKDEIAFAQSYFAVQTRKQELIQDHILLIERLKARKRLKESETELSRNIYERGVDSEGFARIRSKGDQALFGGYTTKKIKEKFDIPQTRPLADFLPTVTISAKNLATEITNFNVEKEDMQGEPPITDEHIKNNQEIRGLLLKRGIKPEELPPEEDIKKLEKMTVVQEKELQKSSGKLIGGKT